MTEASYQQTRKLMQQLKYLRGLITAAKADVGKWTRMEMVFRDQLKHSNADGAKKMLAIAMEKLDQLNKTWASIKLPPSDLPTTKDVNYCRVCNEMIAQIEQYCMTCYQNQNIPKYDFKNRNNKKLPE